MNETLGTIHFVGSFVCMNVVFMPMFLVGLAGVSRRLYDGGASYAFAQPVLHLNVVSSWGAWIMALFQIPFIFNFFWSIRNGEKTEQNPWQATTIEWAAPSPPPHGNFLEAPEAYRGPYEYSVPGAAKDFTPQYRGLIEMDIPYTVEVRRDTGLNNGKIGIWLFLASEVMLFGALFASYILIRTGAPSWPRGDTILNVPLATFNTIVLISSSVTMVMAWASLMRDRFGTFRIYMGATILLGFVFLVVKYFEYSHKFDERALSQHQQLPRHLLHADRPAHAARVRRDVRERLFPGSPARSSGRRTRSGSPTGSRTRASSGTSWIWSGSSCSRPCIFCRRCMTMDHAATSDHDAADIDRHVRIYITVFVTLMVLTIVTVAISRFHLPVPMAVAVALLVATIKGSLVACYFMHLISEKKLIYAVLALTVAFFIVLLVLPVVTVHDGFWIH